MQDHFVLVVSEFIYLPWKEQVLKKESMRNGSLCTPSITAATAEAFESQMSDYIRGQVYVTIHAFHLCLAKLNKNNSMSSRLLLILPVNFLVLYEMPIFI